MSIKQGHRAKFQRITRELSELMEDIREYDDSIWMYAEGGGHIYLMEGHPDSDRPSMSDRQEGIEESSEYIPYMDAGGW